MTTFRTHDGSDMQTDGTCTHFGSVFYRTTSCTHHDFNLPRTMSQQPPGKSFFVVPELLTPWTHSTMHPCGGPVGLHLEISPVATSCARRWIRRSRVGVALVVPGVDFSW
jgi:hypothetical protein